MLDTVSGIYNKSLTNLKLLPSQYLFFHDICQRTTQYNFHTKKGVKNGKQQGCDKQYDVFLQGQKRKVVDHPIMSLMLFAHF